MSTLVNMLLAADLNVLSIGNISNESKNLSEIKNIHCDYSVESINTQFIIKNEQLFHIK
jgi:hypothetical protein